MDFGLLFQVVMKIGGPTSQRGRHALSRKAKQVQFQTTNISLDHTWISPWISPKFLLFKTLLTMFLDFSPFESTDRSSRRNSDRARRSKIDLDASLVPDVHNYRFLQILIHSGVVNLPAFIKQLVWILSFSCEHRIFLATWNVAGKSPPSYLNLEDWLHASPPADIYVLGLVWLIQNSLCIILHLTMPPLRYIIPYFAIRFQEIVPLNAGNVLGTEDNAPAKKWLSLIRKTLNTLPGSNCGCQTPSPIPNPIVELDADFEGSTRQKASSFFHRRSFQSLSRSMRVTGSDMSMPQPRLDRRFSVCDRVSFGQRPSDYDPNFRWGSSDEEIGPGDSPNTTYYSPGSCSGFIPMEDRDRNAGQSRYCLVASKQMVGIFLTVWVKRDLRDDVRNMKVSCVGRGLMGYLGNKVHCLLSWNLTSI